MPIGTDIFRAVRVNKIMKSLRDVRELPGNLAFLGRTQDVPAVDGEIMARFTGYVHIADLVGDDAKAAIYQTDKTSFETTNIPNLKHGIGMNQAQLNEMQSLEQIAIEDPEGTFRQWEQRTIDKLLLGIRQRKEALIIAMMLDGFSYDRLGIRMSNVSWGMPSDLKITPNPAWTDPANATPVTDILEMHRIARVRYGKVFNRMTLSLTAFNLMTATVEFQNRVKQLGLVGLPVGTITVDVANTDFMKALAAPILQLKEIEIYDERYWQQQSDGTLLSAPYLPINKVIFTSTTDDNNSSAYDFANGIVTESIVSSLVPNNVIGQFSGPTRGPVSYVTSANVNLNPPGIVYWGVARGFPRRHDLTASAVMTVGTFTDDIPYGPPY